MMNVFASHGAWARGISSLEREILTGRTLCHGAKPRGFLFGRSFLVHQGNAYRPFHGCARCVALQPPGSSRAMHLRPISAQCLAGEVLDSLQSSLQGISLIPE